METVDLHVDLRATRGKGGARRARAAGRVPAILYGPKRPPLAVLLDGKEFRSKVATVEGAHLIRLSSSTADLNGCLVLTKDIQRHPVTDDVMHADLYEVDVNTKIRVRVPLHFVGKAAGVDTGGILQPLQREVEVLCLPTEIPDFVEVDVSGLGIHDTVTVSEVPMPSGVEVLYDHDEAVVTVLPPTVEEVKAPAVEAAEVAPAGEEPTPAGAAKPEAGAGKGAA
jgi:large subunit ribosomal protein L25